MTKNKAAQTKWRVSLQGDFIMCCSTSTRTLTQKHVHQQDSKGKQSKGLEATVTSGGAYVKAADGLDAGGLLCKVYEGAASVAQQLDTVNRPGPAAVQGNTVLSTRLWPTGAETMTKEHSLTSWRGSSAWLRWLCGPSFPPRWDKAPCQEKRRTIAQCQLQHKITKKTKTPLFIHSMEQLSALAENKTRGRKIKTIRVQPVSSHTLVIFEIPRCKICLLAPPRLNSATVLVTFANKNHLSLSLSQKTTRY